MRIKINLIYFFFAGSLLLALMLYMVFDEKDSQEKSGGVAERVVYARKANMATNKDGDYLSKFKISNPHDVATSIALSIEGRLFRDRAELLKKIQQLHKNDPSEPDYIKAWKLVSGLHYHDDPFTAHSKTHDPLLAINSLGYGYCDDVAAVLAIIWQWLGYESRVWDLQGHVMPEIKIAGEWQMFDPDYGVYYFDRDGSIAGVEALALDPSLILKSTNPIWDEGFTGYSQLLASVYSEEGGRTNVFGKAPVLENFPLYLDIPAKAELRFPVKFQEPVLSVYATTAALSGAASLTLPAGTVGELSFPFVLLDISGEGRVEIADSIYKIGSKELSAYLRGDISKKVGPTEAVTQVNILESKTAIKIVMSLNVMATEGALAKTVNVYQPVGSPSVMVVQKNSQSGFLARISEWVLGHQPWDKNDFSDVSHLLTQTKLNDLASPVSLRHEINQLSYAGR